MTTRTRLALTVTLVLSISLVCRAQEEEAVAVTADSYHAQFSARDAAQQMRVEIFSPSGERVFDSGAAFGQAVEWDLRDQKGERVTDGVYMASITVTDQKGLERKRLEQVVVSSANWTAAPNTPPTANGDVTTTNGTVGKLAKFTGASAIGDSAATESSYKIGINSSAPSATLQVNGLQPVTVATNGTNASVLLQTTGGKGGNTSGSGKTGGKGASISLVAGNGGNAPSTGFNGSGGSITLQPGSAGTGGTGGTAGNVLIASTAGRVGVGTSTPKAVVDITGEAGSSQVGDTAAPTAILSVTNTSNTLFIRPAVLVTNQYGPAINATGAAIGVQTSSTAGDAVYAVTTSGTAVFGSAQSGTAIYGSSASGLAGSFTGRTHITGKLEIDDVESFESLTDQKINLYSTTYGIGVQDSTFYFRTNGGYNWYRGGVHRDAQNAPGTGGVSLMRLDSAGNLTVKGSVTGTTFVNSSDRALKSNFASVDPRAVLDRLAAVPVETWSYKAEADGVRHMGPMAQDFRAAFNLGTDDKTISTVDTAGVTMAAIQGLYQMMREKDRQIAELRTELNHLKATVSRKGAKTRKK